MEGTGRDIKRQRDHQDLEKDKKTMHYYKETLKER